MNAGLLPLHGAFLIMFAAKIFGMITLPWLVVFSPVIIIEVVSIVVLLIGASIITK